MKYGFAGGGQSDGFGDAQSYAAAASAAPPRAARRRADGASHRIKEDMGTSL
jgi:hypothetical protein